MTGPLVQYHKLSPEWKACAEEFGLSSGGVCSALPSSAEVPQYQNWLSQGYHGEMAYLERHQSMKYNPQALMPEVKSMIFFTLNYFQAQPPEKTDFPEGRVARYAWGRDYHKTLGNKLRSFSRFLQEKYPGEVFRSFTDSGPLAERHYAQKCGLGFVGKHTLLIHPQKGSWFLLGEIMTSLPPSLWTGGEDVPPETSQGAGCPSGCFRCSRICPTGALLSPGLMDARRCISYLTIEYKGVIPLELRDKMGTWVFGCDLCQEVCPFNLKAEITSEQDFLTWRLGPTLDLAEILSLDEPAFERKFAGTPAWRTGRRCLVRNACVAAGNSGSRKLIPQLKVLSQGADSLVSEHASWALGKLEGGPV